MIICDSREKENQRVIEYFEKHHVPYRIEALETGDYMDSDRMTITVDRKKDLVELTRNLCSNDQGRFWREIRRSKAEGIKMIVLCEHGGKIKTIKDVASWKNPYSKVSGRSLMNEIYRVHIAYGVEFLFCDKRSTGRRILELLEYDGRRD